MQLIHFHRGQLIGLIVRGKYSESHRPFEMNQHADCILSNGEPVGFFGGPEAAVGEAFKSMRSSLTYGFNMRGFVRDFQRFNRQVRPYVNIGEAILERRVCTLLIIPVNKNEADAFDSYWAKLKINPGMFNLLGHNCSTRAWQAFNHAGVIKNAMPGLDTPDNLYRHLRLNRENTVTYSGFLGFQPDERSSEGYRVLVKELHTTGRGINV